MRWGNRLLYLETYIFYLWLFFSIFISSELTFSSYSFLPSIIPADSPDANCVDRLRVECVQTLRIYQLQGSVVQIHEQVFALELKYSGNFSPVIEISYFLEYNDLLLSMIRVDKNPCWFSFRTDSECWFLMHGGANLTKLTSPQRPTWSSRSFLPKLRSTMHLLTARLDRSGVRSDSAISTQPSERTKNRTARPSASGRAGKLRRLEIEGFYARIEIVVSVSTCKLVLHLSRCFLIETNDGIRTGFTWC